MLNKKATIVVLVLGLLPVSIMGRIVHPWGAAPAIVCVDSTFSVYLIDTLCRSIDSVMLRGPYNQSRADLLLTDTGRFSYDRDSLAVFHQRLFIKVPPGTPSELYDLLRLQSQLNIEQGCFHQP